MHLLSNQERLTRLDTLFLLLHHYGYNLSPHPLGLRQLDLANILLARLLQHQAGR